MARLYKLDDVTIVQSGINKTKVFINGNEINGITDINYHNRVGEIPEVTLTFYAGTVNNTGIDINKQEKTGE